MIICLSLSLYIYIYSIPRCAAPCGVPCGDMRCDATRHATMGLPHGTLDCRRSACDVLSGTRQLHRRFLIAFLEMHKQRQKKTTTKIVFSRQLLQNDPNFFSAHPGRHERPRWLRCEAIEYRCRPLHIRMYIYIYRERERDR